jgi:hypothetical protein
MYEIEKLEKTLEEIRDQQREHFGFVRRILEEHQKRHEEAQKHEIARRDDQDFVTRLYKIDVRRTWISCLQLACYVLIFIVLLYMSCRPQ